MGISSESLLIFVLILSVANPAFIWVSKPSRVNSPQQVVTDETPHRIKRSPFIMAFQVTRPPGMFQMSLRRPYIFSMMSNLTSMILTSNITTALRRGFAGILPSSPLPSENATVLDAIQSRQEDLELLDKK